MDPWKFPFLLHVPSRKGRKPVSIPDMTQFSVITRNLFGVGCITPTEVYSYSAHNEVYLLELDVSEASHLPRWVLARVARDLKTRSDISLESEVATMVYVRQKCPDVPVPIVYGYCPTRNNVIGEAFSVVSFTMGMDMNHDGVPWESLPLQTKLIGVRDLATIISRLSQLHFKAIGSIYFKFSDTQASQVPVGFVLGPVSWSKLESAARTAAFEHDRGPWKTTAQWLRASVEDEIQFLDKLPRLAKETSSRRHGCESRLKLAKRVLPQFLDRIPDSKDDPFDQCAGGPFVLGNIDLSPKNFLFCSRGPDAGRILSVINWESSLTVPLWALICYPRWFSRLGGLGIRKPAEAQHFRDTYIRELQKHAQESIVLRVVQNAQYEARRRFSEIATLPWDLAEIMERWLEENPRH
ncbi:serine threonine protein kinase [Favolaschia claudopus]|uniref:Serine threonine protein kinase n=1 Tax=Favolaschia claudopus TaxID=2862362 RepID=A0AAW0BAY8_9AGAR